MLQHITSKLYLCPFVFMEETLDKRLFTISSIEERAFATSSCETLHFSARPFSSVKADSRGVIEWSDSNW